MLASWISNTLNIVMASSPWNNSLMIGHVKGMDGWHGRLTWKAKGTVSAWRRRRSSWSLVMATMSSKKYVKYSCAVCCNGVGCSSILCPQCILWIHKKYSRITKRLTPDENYVFPRCKGESMAELWLTWMSTAPYLMWLSHFATYGIRCAQWGLRQCHWGRMLCSLGKVQETLAWPNHQTPVT